MELERESGFPGPGGQLPREETQFELDPYEDALPRKIPVPGGQYRQVFDAIVRSNGWDNATAALQLLSHLQGDTLNVALLVLPESRRASRVGLVGALTGTAGGFSAPI